MTLNQRISAFDELGQFFNFLAREKQPENEQLLHKFLYWKDDANLACRNAEAHNNWFTQENIRFALENWADALTENNLSDWVADYSLSETPKNVGIIMAGNLPLVGFHDLLAVVLFGHRALVKPSSKDEKLLDLVIHYLQSIDEEFKDRIQKVERLENFDAVIATGSNNTARYFEHYFSQVPHIIRKNRTSVAVLDGSESKEDLMRLGEDFFRYFGLGCRNVTKIYTQKETQIQELIEAIFPWGENIVQQTKYANNYDYNRAIYLLSKDKFYDNNFVLIKEDEALHSPIAVLHYELYDDLEDVKTTLKNHEEEIQCVVSKLNLENRIDFGQTQHPTLTDYADGIDTLAFLSKI